MTGEAPRRWEGEGLEYGKVRRFDGLADWVNGTVSRRSVRDMVPGETGWILWDYSRSVNISELPSIGIDLDAVLIPGDLGGGLKIGIVCIEPGLYDVRWIKEY